MSPSARGLPTLLRAGRLVIATACATAGLAVVAVAPAAAAAPDAPAQPAVAAANAAITVTFDPPYDGGSPITGYTAGCTSSDGGAPGVNADAASPITVTGLTNGNTYTCTVTATNADGTSFSSPASNPVVPNTVPDPPAQPDVQVGSEQVEVSFTPPFDGGSPITGYTASCTSSDGGAPGVNADAASPITVTGLTNGNTYTCTVTATNADGTSFPSPASNAVVLSRAPDAPAQPSVSAGNASIVVGFSPPFDGGSPITSYSATCISNDGVTPPANVASGSPITVTGLTNGSTYTCTVNATNVNGTGPDSTASQPVVPSGVPDAPVQPTVKAGNAQVAVTVTPPIAGGSAITGYTASCTSSDGGSAGASNTTSGTTVVVASLTNGRHYTCVAAALNDEGQGGWSPASSAVVPSTVPGAPKAPAVRGANQTIVASVAAPLNGGSTITAYTAWCSSRDGGKAATKTAKTPSITITGVTNGRHYTCTMAATNANGLGWRSAASAQVVPDIPVLPARGFRLFAGDGGVFGFGADRGYGSAAGHAKSLVVGMATTPDGAGYWMAATDGSVYRFGDARDYGAPKVLNKPIVGITATTTGRGYWLVASDGGIFGYGDAHFYGSTGSIRLQKPIIAMAATPTGKGYWLIASDGGMFGYGDARFYGSTGSVHLAQPIVGAAVTRSGLGYWLADADGTVYAFGDATRFGHGAIKNLSYPIRGIASTPTGQGIWLAAGNGAVYVYGDAPFYGWPGPVILQHSIRGIAR